MSIQSITAATARVAPSPVKDAQAPVKNAASPAPASATQPAYAVTISQGAKLAAAAGTQPSQAAPPAGAAAKAARPPVVHAVPTTSSAAQTTASQYVAKVRAALASGGNRSVSQVMAALGVPQADQTQVAAALGTAPKS